MLTGAKRCNLRREPFIDVLTKEYGVPGPGVRHFSVPKKSVPPIQKPKIVLAALFQKPKKVLAPSFKEPKEVLTSFFKK